MKHLQLFEYFKKEYRKSQKPKIKLEHIGESSFIYSTLDNKWILKLTTDQYEVINWNQLKNIKNTYNPIIQDVSMISFGIYAIMYEKIKLFSEKELLNILRSDMNKNEEFKEKKLQWFQFQISGLLLLTEEEFQKRLVELNLNGGIFKKILVDLRFGDKERIRNKLMNRDIDISKLGINKNRKWCSIDIEGQILSVPKKLKEIILDPNPEIFIGNNLSSKIISSKEIQKNVNRLVRLYYQYLKNEKKLKI